MEEVRVIPFPEHEPRVETGPVQFGNDWPGVFIRGDSAFGIRMSVLRVMEIVRERDWLAAVDLDDLCDLLDSCTIRDGGSESLNS